VVRWFKNLWFCLGAGPEDVSDLKDVSLITQGEVYCRMHLCEIREKYKGEYVATNGIDLIHSRNFDHFRKEFVEKADFQWYVMHIDSM
jgi:hypothetical protein